MGPVALLPDGPVALLGHILQEPARGHLLAEAALGIRPQPGVTIEESHQGRILPQPGELPVLRQAGPSPTFPRTPGGSPAPPSSQHRLSALGRVTSPFCTGLPLPLWDLCRARGLAVALGKGSREGCAA